MTASITTHADQLLGADPEGRLYLHVTDSDSQSDQELVHWDLLPRPNLLMESAYGRAGDQRDLDVTVALLVDIGWVICGDGRVTVPEECDDGDGHSNSNTARNACRTNCKSPTCGDGVVDLSEDCDDGQNGGGQLYGCRADCKIDLCGNAIVDADEQCDEGLENGSRLSVCDVSCELESQDMGPCDGGRCEPDAAVAGDGGTCSGGACESDGSRRRWCERL